MIALPWWLYAIVAAYFGVATYGPISINITQQPRAPRAIIYNVKPRSPCYIALVDKAAGGALDPAIWCSPEEMHQ